mmetsp:Transcript_13688/g.9844  ORF Transcript_13688/g.9844 Transcript_13688/m.9844 type:complete len:110 (+) Transcript_13688:353-682(+)|eukprot:CAMPEP_0202972060 /NCGR_PEP_ID=MMETSP1396-20130829/33001_1 /ASSEMBLY_ACC=CAM_ASM_000872 /TAXON_ID= /ORGANISM="Pseudokeronopsis sp., Strain Brazil" /LENGTH=109 /DNA_ID=CAMNT_0049702071 /DNA_START=353 /DNA_END=682 /DNA_ORIENTATION=-
MEYYRQYGHLWELIQCAEEMQERVELKLPKNYSMSFTEIEYQKYDGEGFFVQHRDNGRLNCFDVKPEIFQNKNPVPLNRLLTLLIYLAEEPWKKGMGGELDVQANIGGR